MPSLPKPRLRRSARARVVPRAASTEPNVEEVRHGGLRWINVERPGSVDRAWLEEHFDFHPLDYEDVLSATQRPKIDEYDEYLFIVLYFPVFDKSVGRLNAAELDIFIGPNFQSRCRTPRCRRWSTSSSAAAPRRRCARACSPRAAATSSTGSSTTPSTTASDAAQDRQQARTARGGHLRGPLRGGRARHLQLEAGDHQLPQDHPAPARGARPRAHQGPLPGRGPRDLLRRHRRRLGADLGHARELQSDRGARGHQRVGALPSRERGAACSPRSAW